MKPLNSPSPAKTSIPPSADKGDQPDFGSAKIPNQKSIDDLLKVERIMAVANSDQGEEYEFICIAIRKIVHLQDLKISEFFTRQAPSGTVTLTTFKQTLASLKLVPEVCNDSQIRDLFNQIDKAGSGSVK